MWKISYILLYFSFVYALVFRVKRLGFQLKYILCGCSTSVSRVAVLMFHVLRLHSAFKFYVYVDCLLVFYLTAWFKTFVQTRLVHMAFLGYFCYIHHHLAMFLLIFKCQTLTISRPNRVHIYIQFPNWSFKQVWWEFWHNCIFTNIVIGNIETWNKQWNNSGALCVCLFCEHSHSTDYALLDIVGA